MHCKRAAQSESVPPPSPLPHSRRNCLFKTPPPPPRLTSRRACSSAAARACWQPWIAGASQRGGRGDATPALVACAPGSAPSSPPSVGLPRPRGTAGPLTRELLPSPPLPRSVLLSRRQSRSLPPASSSRSAGQRHPD